MIITSEFTGKEYSTVEDCLAAEKAYKEELIKKQEAEAIKEQEKDARYDELKESLQFAVDAVKEYEKKLHEYLKDYGSISIKTKDVNYDPWREWMKLFF